MILFHRLRLCFVQPALAPMRVVRSMIVLVSPEASAEASRSICTALTVP